MHSKTESLIDVWKRLDEAIDNLDVRERLAKHVSDHEKYMLDGLWRDWAEFDEMLNGAEASEQLALFEAAIDEIEIEIEAAHAARG
jgi:hypothetical protein